MTWSPGSGGGRPDDQAGEPTTRLSRKGSRTKGPSKGGPGRSYAGTILLVDDDPDILESLTLFLNLNLPDLKVLTAGSGPAALDVLERNRIDLLITDYRMGEMNGLDLLTRARAIRPDLSSIVITAYPDPALADRVRNQAGTISMMAKPLEMDIFVGAVQDFLFQKGPRPRGP